MPGRDGPENFEDFEEIREDIQPLERVLGFFGSDQSRSVWVSSGRGGLKS